MSEKEQPTAIDEASEALECSLRFMMSSTAAIESFNLFAEIFIRSAHKEKSRVEQESIIDAFKEEFLEGLVTANKAMAEDFMVTEAPPEFTKEHGDEILEALESEWREHLRLAPTAEDLARHLQESDSESSDDRTDE